MLSFKNGHASTIYIYDKTLQLKDLYSLALLPILLMLAGFAWKAIYNVLLHPLSTIPGPLPAKLFGSYLTPAQASLHRAHTLRRLHDLHGPVVRVGPNEVSISDWQAYREIYSPKGSSKTHHFYADTQLSGHDNIFTMADKEMHAGRRKLQNQSYSQQAVLGNEALISDKADVLVRRMVPLGKDSFSRNTVDAFRLNGLFSLEVILACAYNRHFGDSPSSESFKLLKAMDSSAVGIQIAAALPFLNRRIGKLLPGSVGHSFREWDVWQQMTTKLLKDFQTHEADSDTRLKYMTTPLLVNEDSYLGRKLTEDELVEELMGLTFAGSGTTSSTLTYLIYSLCQDTLTQDRLREELKTTGHSLNEVKNLPWLNAIIKETMRLYPTIISTLPRVLDRPLSVGKHALPKGTFVGMQNYVHHRDPTLFPHPDDFLPDRWLARDTKDMEAALTPFSLGPHNCIGQNLARAELYLATSAIFRNLKLRLNPDMTAWDMEMEDRFNIAPKGRRLLVDVEEVVVVP